MQYNIIQNNGTHYNSTQYKAVNSTKNNKVKKNNKTEYSSWQCIVYKIQYKSIRRNTMYYDFYTIQHKDDTIQY